MKIEIISGSHRENQTHRVAMHINKLLKEEYKKETYFLSLANNPLSLWS